jgi:hypothetical protein
MLKLDTKSVRGEISKIMDIENVSPIEMASAANIRPGTIYRIINMTNPTTHRSVVRKIAEAFGYDMIIEGDQVQLVKMIKNSRIDMVNDSGDLKDLLYDLSEYTPEIKKLLARAQDKNSDIYLNILKIINNLPQDKLLSLWVLLK